MLAAPIIHARTKYYDFPSGLLVIPDNFTSQDAQWARSYITQSTRYMEMMGTAGRRVVFSNASVVVSGLSIRIEDLYNLCGKSPQYSRVDGNRVNYAFIGLVIPKSQITTTFDIPYSVFLEQYETYMQILWEMPPSESSITTTKVVYSQFRLPQAQASCELPRLENEKMRIVLDTNDFPLESICAQVALMAQEGTLGFCSDVPNATSVTDSNFSIVTSKYPQQIIAALEREAAKSTAYQPQDTRKFNPFFKFIRKDASTQAQVVLNQVAAEVKKTWKAIPKVIKVGSLLIVVLSSLANKKSD